MVSGEPPTLSGGPGSNTGKADREAAKGLQQQELCRLDSCYRTDALIYGRDVRDVRDARVATTAGALPSGLPLQDRCPHLRQGRELSMSL